MINSMTGYGRCELEEGLRKINVEISSVNHRYCDINIRMPRTLNHLEESVRKALKEKIARGKIELGIYYTSMSQDDIEVVVNEPVCASYIESLRQVGEKFGLVDNLGIAEIIAINDIINVQKKPADVETIWVTIEKCLEQAIEEFQAMRTKEGEALKSDILLKTDYIKTVIEKVEGLSERVVDEYRGKLQDRLQKLLDHVPVDEARIATEVAMFADRCAIDEELIRLKSHVEQLRSILEAGGVVGRKLDFLMQEMNREANTIASKSGDYTITNYAVELKTEIEKIREQIQNIE
ncbi:MAG: YicC/YloC family endoribonuclease [Cellulosilyticaceae bacterium]